MGDLVRIINFFKHAKDKWLAGVVTDKHGPLTYLITWTMDVYSDDILAIYVYGLIVRPTWGHHTLLWEFQMLLFQNVITII